MRRLRVVFGLAVAVCAFGALTVSAAAKEKLVFGTFVASVQGQAISEKDPAPLKQDKEDEVELTGLQLGPYKFGRANKAKGIFEYEVPCLKSPKISGEVTAERSSSLLTQVDFRQCVSSFKGSVSPFKAVSFKLGIRFLANESAEIGKTAENGIEISEKTTVDIKGAGNCLVVIPEQFVPGKAAEKEEKFWESAEYSPEAPEAIENWEKSKKLKEEYPSGFKDRLEIETTEKFKGIRTYVDTAGTSEKKGCLLPKGEENGKLITEKEIEVEGEHGLEKVANPYYLWTEFKNGRLDMDAEGLEVKGGELTFEPPA